MKKQAVPFPRSYWVVPGKFLAGYYPGSRDPVTAENKLTSLLAYGIRHIVNLMEENERNFSGEIFVPYGGMLEEIAVRMNIPLEIVHKPIRDMDVPTVETMVLILDEIDRAIQHNQIVYLHCWGGRGRTGTVVGCYLARHGMGVGEDALELLSALRRKDPIFHLSSPETEVQAQFVRAWLEGA